MPKGNTISKTRVIVPATVAALVLMMTPTMAFAQNPHFIGTPDCSVDSAGNLDCAGRLAGLGNARTVESFLVADVQATFGCDNPGRGIHVPPGQPTETTPVTGDAETLRVRNGQASFDLSIDAPTAPEDFCAKRGWTPVLASVTYTNVAVVIGDDRVPIEGTFSGP
jgi:hypothetical protein